MLGHRLATLCLLAVACDGQFSFDRGQLPPFGAGNAAGMAGSSGVGGTTGTGAADTGGAATGVSGADAAAGCARCAEYGLVCEDTTGACVECNADADCTDGANPHCDETLHRCTPCSALMGCDPGYVCDGWSHSCLRSCATELDPDHDCDRSTHMCDTNRSVCVECHGDDDCYDNPQGEHCAGSARCAECAVDHDCTKLGRFCDPLSFTCVVCRDFHDCGSTLVCDPASHTCVGGDE
jgi:hypothetical protein